MQVLVNGYWCEMCVCEFVCVCGVCVCVCDPGVVQSVVGYVRRRMCRCYACDPVLCSCW